MSVAILAGNDYSPGVNGIGITTAIRWARDGRIAWPILNSILLAGDLDSPRSQKLIESWTRAVDLPSLKPIEALKLIRRSWAIYNSALSRRTSLPTMLTRIDAIEVITLCDQLLGIAPGPDMARYLSPTLWLGAAMHQLLAQPLVNRKFAE